MKKTTIIYKNFPNSLFIFMVSANLDTVQKKVKTSKRAESSKAESEIKIAGEVSNLFCPPPCGGLLIKDSKSGLHRCIKCIKYWRYKGTQRVVTTPAEPAKEIKITKKREWE